MIGFESARLFAQPGRIVWCAIVNGVETSLEADQLECRMMCNQV